MSEKIKKVLVLVNPISPISGKGRGRAVAGRLAAAFEQNGLEAKIIVLPGPGSVAALEVLAPWTEPLSCMALTSAKRAI